MREHPAQRLEGARIAQVVEQQDRLQDDVGLGVGEQPHRQLEAARAAQLEHLEAGVAQHRVMIVAQVLGDALLRQQVGSEVQHPLADARAGVAHQQLDLRAALAQRHRRQRLEQAHGAVPGELGGGDRAHSLNTPERLFSRSASSARLWVATDSCSVAERYCCATWAI